MKAKHMKKLVLVAAVVALAAAQVQTAKAGDREWATAGKILTGVAVGAVVASAINANASYSVTYSSAPAYCPPPAPVIVAPAPVVYCPPPVVYAPPRVVYAPAPAYCPPPVVVYRAPVYCPPPRVVYYDRHGPRGHGHGHGPGHRW